MENFKLKIVLTTAMAVFTIVATNLTADGDQIYEMPESGAVLDFSSGPLSGSTGGLDPPDDSSLPKLAADRTSNRFELPESGGFIDFNDDADSWPGRSGFLYTNRSFDDRGHSAPSAVDAYELPETGHMLVFPRRFRRLLDMTAAK